MGIRKKVAILALGGTISGHSPSRLDFLDYKCGHYSFADLVNEIREIRDIAEITGEQLESFNSSEMTLEHWMMLKEKVESYLNTKGFDGVVITHGTNTLEETAYFLHLTVDTTKPVVLVGAQRPYSGLGTDAGINLYHAVRVAASEQSQGKGVLVVFNQEINSAREVTKTMTYGLQTFQSGQMGVLGFADADGTIQYYRNPSRLHTEKSRFSAVDIKTDLDVAILYSYAGSNGDLIQAVAECGRYSGIVMAGMGAGMLTGKEEKALAEAQQKGLRVVRSSRVGNGRVVDIEQYRGHGFIYADNLLPQKARILLMLCIMADLSREEIQEVFNTH